MEFAGIKVVTPLDNPSQYQPDWRHHIAKLINDCPDIVMPPQLRQDRWVERQVNFLRYGFSAPKNAGWLDTQWQAARAAFAIYCRQDDNNIRDYIEPLLLTDQPYDIVAKDLGQSPEMVEYYERVYWSCRTDDGCAQPAEMVRTSFAQGIDMDIPTGQPNTLSRAVAAHLGYTALTYLWRWQKPAGDRDPDDVVFKLLNRVNLGGMIKLSVLRQMQPMDYNMWFAQFVSYARLLHDTKAGAKDEAMELVAKFFKLTAPKMLEAHKAMEQLRDYQVGSMRRLEAQHEIDGTAVDDAGRDAGDAALAAALRKATGPLAAQYQETRP